MAAPTVNFLLYNPTGLDSLVKWTRELLCSMDIQFVSIQEHFKKNVGNMFHKQFPKYVSYVIPATRAVMQDSGRPKGGLAQMPLESIQTKAKRILGFRHKYSASRIFQYSG